MPRPFPLLLLLLCFLPLVPAAAAPGEPDFTFGDGGVTKIPEGIGGSGLAVQSDGKILVNVTASSGGSSDFGVARYMPDGSLDPSFGTEGVVTTDIATSGDFLTALLVQGDGKVVATGITRDPAASNSLVAVVRYAANGTIDTGFGNGGKATADFGVNVVTTGAVLQPDGKIVVCGYVGNVIIIGTHRIYRRDFGMARFNANGSLDTSFGTGGKVVTDFGNADAKCLSIAMQTDGKILLTGTGVADSVTGQYGFTLVRYLPNGTLDGTFGSGGILLSHFGATSDVRTGNYSNKVAVQADGKIVVAGDTQFIIIGAADDAAGLTGSYVLALARYLPDGTFDSSFGTGGYVLMPIQKSIPKTRFVASGVNDLVLQGDGKIVVSADVIRSFDLFRDDIALVRFGLDGALDETFGSEGLVLMDFDGNDVPTDLALGGDGRIVLTAGIGGDEQADGTAGFSAILRFFGGNSPVQPAQPVADTTTVRTDGATFLSFGAPAVDGGLVGGAATARGSDGRKQTLIYDGTNGAGGAALAQTGGMDEEGATFIELGDPAFAGEAIGFAGVAAQSAATIPPLLRMDARIGFDAEKRAARVQPGGRLAALYSQLSRVAGVRRLAVQTGPAPGVTDGQFARFNGFGLPRGRLGMFYSALLHRGGSVNAANDFGVWRERSDGSGTDLLLRTGPRFSLARGTTAGAREFKKLTLQTPVANATDQRRSFASDGGVAALATFPDGGSGVARVAADGSVDVPVETTSEVRGEDGAAIAGAEFSAFTPPATASAGRLALLANLRAAARGVPPPASPAIFSSQAGSLRRVLARGDAVPGLTGVRFGALGQPLLGEKGMIGLIAALTGRRVTPANRTAVTLMDGRVKAVVARLGEQAVGLGEKVTYRRFMSVVVTDSDPARLLFTATIGGPGVKAADNTGLWSVSTATGSNLILRKGGTIMVGGQPLTVRTFEALQAPRKSMGQGRSTDASGFVTAKVKLNDGRQGVLRIPLP